MNAQHIRRTVVVGIDGSDNALHAVRWGAAAEARRREVPLRLVHAFGWAHGQVTGHPELGEGYRDTLLGHAREQLAAGLAATEAPGSMRSSSRWAHPLPSSVRCPGARRCSCSATAASAASRDCFSARSPRRSPHTRHVPRWSHGVQLAKRQVSRRCRWWSGSTNPPRAMLRLRSRSRPPRRDASRWSRSNAASMPTPPRSASTPLACSMITRLVRASR